MIANGENQMPSLKAYRSAIRQVWLPLTGRKKLTSYEHKLIGEWFSQQIPVSLILRAIEIVKSRGAVFSLGVIRADLENLRRERAASQIGTRPVETSTSWRTKWDETLAELILDTKDESLRAKYEAFRADLPGLTYEQAQKRIVEIRK